MFRCIAIPLTQPVKLGLLPCKEDIQQYQLATRSIVNAEQQFFQFDVVNLGVVFLLFVRSGSRPVRPSSWPSCQSCRVVFVSRKFAVNNVVLFFYSSTKNSVKLLPLSKKIVVIVYVHARN